MNIRNPLAPLLCAGLAIALLASAATAAERTSAWDGYLDYAYVYVSAEPEALRARLKQYGQEAGLSLPQFIARQYEGTAKELAGDDESALRREAIAHLLVYLESGEPQALEQSVEAIGGLEERLGRHENRYWHHTIHAYRALEKGHTHDFVTEVLKLWLRVVVPLETPYETLHTLSLSDSPNSGFVSALPYIYENLARMILIRSQRMGVDRDLDPLGAVVRMLADHRVGAHPDVIPPEASARDYLARIVERLDGPESDAGSLTFTLALFEASKEHDRARGLLASEGLSEKTQDAIRATSGAYETALNRAGTVQGQAAVYTRVLREVGEVYAAKQRLGLDPDIEIPFTIEGAIETYEKMVGMLAGGHEELGYRHSGRRAYLDAMHHLWEEIQEASLNAADFYLSRASGAKTSAGDEHARNAGRVYSRYLALFTRFATTETKEGVPDSAYFAAYESAKGFGDAMLAYTKTPTPEEIELATRRYRSAIALFPFDRNLWRDLTAALARHGRESEYLELVRPIAEWVVRSRSINTWIENEEPGSEEIATLRQALSDSMVLMHMGFAEASGIGRLEQDLGALRARREEAERKLDELVARRDALAGGAAAPDPEALSGAELAGNQATLEYQELTGEIGSVQALLDQLEKQEKARSHSLPVYKASFESRDFADELRGRRDHPLHTLLRRMYHENRS